MRITIFMGLLLVLSASTCNNEEDFRREVTLTFGETVTFSSENLQIGLIDVNDSRCPLNVTCVWAGEARMTFEVGKNGAEEILELKTKGLCEDESGPCGEEKDLFGYRFKLLFVYPYPEEGLIIEKEEYSVKMEIAEI